MKVLMKGNEALAEAAIRAGCRLFFGYPITPQNEIPEYLARRMPEVGGTFLQAESEVAAINMVYGAAGTGQRVMTSSSGPGISLKQEGISFLAGAELPCVIVNMMRGGPGLGSIQASQSDYFQATKGGGHGDYRIIVLAPGSVQELADMTVWAFELAEKYTTPVMILGDGTMGQMMEPVDLDTIPIKTGHSEFPWATTGCKDRPKRIINSLYLDATMLERHNQKLQRKYRLISEELPRAEAYHTDDAELVLVAFGTAARIARGAVDQGRANGLRLGLVRPITLWPFPGEFLLAATTGARKLLVVEMNTGQMVEDVRLVVEGRIPVHFHGRCGGMLPTVKDILAQIEEMGV